MKTTEPDRWERNKYEGREGSACQSDNITITTESAMQLANPDFVLVFRLKSD